MKLSLCLDINKVSDFVPKFELMVCFKIFLHFFFLYISILCDFTIFFVVFLQGLRTSWSWPRSRPFWSSGWLCYWYSRRCRSSWNSTAAPTVCWNDFNSYFRWGLCDFTKKNIIFCYVPIRPYLYFNFVWFHELFLIFFRFWVFTALSWLFTCSRMRIRLWIYYEDIKKKKITWNYQQIRAFFMILKLLFFPLGAYLVAI